MTAAEIVEELRPLGKDSYKKVMFNHGAREPYFGVSIEEQRAKIAMFAKELGIKSSQ